MPDTFIYMWTYEVSPESVDEFLQLYGPRGAWVALFRRASGYLDTQLFADRDRRGRFLTIDRWESSDAFTSFRTDFAAEFERLDGLGQMLTTRESRVGEFDPVV